MNNIREIRISQGMTQTQLANGILDDHPFANQVLISFLETVDIYPGERLIRSLCRALNCSPEAIRFTSDITNEEQEKYEKKYKEIKEKEDEKRRIRAHIKSKRQKDKASGYEKHCIYKHTFPDGKIYIGQSISGNTLQRWRDGIGYYGQSKVFSAIVRFGWDNITHEIIMDGLTQEEADAQEHRLIAEYNAIDGGYNSAI